MDQANLDVSDKELVFRENMEPIIEHYDEDGLFERIDGEQALDGVSEDVKVTIENVA